MLVLFLDTICDHFFNHCCPVLVEEKSVRLSFQNVKTIHMELGASHVLLNVSNQDVISSQTQSTVQMRVLQGIREQIAQQVDFLF